MKCGLCGIALVFLAAACSSNVQTPEAVKQGVIKDLAKRVDVQNMDVNVDSVSFRDHEADALVSFAPKGAPRSQGMTMRYRMQRSGDEWHIAGRSSGDLKRHEQAGPQGGTGQSPGSQLPAGHPAIGGQDSNSGALPAGHPPIRSGETR